MSLLADSAWMQYPNLDGSPTNDAACGLFMNAKIGNWPQKKSNERAHQPHEHRSIHVKLPSLAIWNQIRRWMFGKSSQTLMPQKWEPSVQMGVVMPARMWHGGPM